MESMTAHELARRLLELPDHVVLVGDKPMIGLTVQRVHGAGKPRPAIGSARRGDIDVVCIDGRHEERTSGTGTLTVVAGGTRLGMVKHRVYPVLGIETCNASGGRNCRVQVQLTDRQIVLYGNVPEIGLHIVCLTHDSNVANWVDVVFDESTRERMSRS